jgi:Ser/Thr protein kinase RdoA (MazF antagonist)
MNYFKILGIADRANQKTLLQVQGWFWQRTERIRWITTGPKEALPPLEDISATIIIGDHGRAKDLAELPKLRNVKVFCVGLSNPRESLPGNLIGLSLDLWGEQPELMMLLKDLNIQAPRLAFQLEPGDFNILRTLTDPQMMNAAEFSPQGDLQYRDWFHLALAKYFGASSVPSLHSVGGGWSRTPILRLETNGSAYFIKFFRSQDELKGEVTGHMKAGEWLQGRAVQVKFVDGMESTPAELIKAFPVSEGMFPLCVHSVSDRNAPRRTLDDLYAEASLETASQLVRSVLQATRQDGHLHRLAPIKNPSLRNAVGDFILNEMDRRSVIRNALHDLHRPLLQLDPEWGPQDANKGTPLKALTESQYPPWLRDAVPVLVGHIHGDLNARNCLFNPSDPQDLRFIDLGGYREDGFLIHDLCLLEISIKWATMGVEKDPSPYQFGDIDTNLLRDARDVEAAAVKKGLAFTQEDLLAALPADRRADRGVNCALSRAYSLVAIIRERAKELSTPHDPTGKHYFGALLALNLRWLRIPHIPATKKALALYSSALILEQFK